jgi:hypothetical protein
MGVGNQLQKTKSVMKLSFGVVGIAFGANDFLYTIGAVTMVGASYMNASCFCLTNGCHTTEFWVCKLQSNERALFIQDLFLFGGSYISFSGPNFSYELQPSYFCYFSFVKLRWISERLVY